MSELPADQMLADPAAFLERFYVAMTEDVLDGVPDEVVIDRYHTPDVVQVADGITLDRARLVAHLGPVRRTLQEFGVEVHEAVAQGEVVAARLTFRALQRDHPVAVDVHFFGRFAPDGRLRSSHQLTATHDVEVP